MKRKQNQKKLTSLFNSSMKKKFVAVISSVMAVFVVVSIVGATSTIGLNISTDGNLTVTGTTTQTGAFTAAAAVTANGTVTLGDASTDLLTINSTATFVNNLQASSTALFSSGWTSYSAVTVSSSATSTLNGSYLFEKNSATTTLQVGRAGVATAGMGGCIALQSASTSGTSMLFLYFDGLSGLATSTNPKVCY